MSLQRGVVVLGRFRLRAPLPPQGELQRWAAEDTTDGSAAEIVAPQPQVLIRPGARERFLRAREGLPTHPAVLRPLQAGLHQGLPVAAYPAGAVPWPEATLRAPAEVIALAAWLLPALPEAADELGGSLRAADLALDAKGAPRLRPAGILHKPALARGDVDTPPEPDPEPLAGALYGLGVQLFAAATGQLPFTAQTAAELARQQQHPPRASAAQPGVPPELDGLIADLLSPEPARRRAAARRISPGDPPRFPYPAETTLADPESAIQAAPPPMTAAPARRSASLQAWVVLVEPAGQPERLLRRLAALAEVPTAALVAAGRQGVAVPVATAREAAQAQDLAEELGKAGVPLRVASLGGGWGGPLLLLGGGLLVGLAALVVTLVGVFAGAGLLIAGFLGLLALALLAAGAAGAWRGYAARQRLESASTLLDREIDRGPLAAELAAARRALLRSELPVPARADLLSAVDDLEDALPAADPAQRERIAAALAELQAAGAAPLRAAPAEAERAAEEASRRAQAARAALRE